MIRQEINLTKKEIQALIILIISAELEDISVYCLQGALLVSRGAVLADLKKYRNTPKQMLSYLSIVGNLAIAFIVMKD